MFLNIMFPLTFDHDITSTNVDQFTKFFYCQIPEEIMITHKS